MIEPVDAPVLKISQRVMSRGAGQLVLAEHGLLFPGIDLVRGLFGWPPVDPVTAFDRRSAVASGRNPLRSDDLSLHVETVDQETVALIFQVLKQRAGVLPHQYRVRGIIMNSQLIADAVSLADSMERDPRAR